MGARARRTVRRNVGFLALAVVVAVSVYAALQPATTITRAAVAGADRDCASFESWLDAQRFFLSQQPGDPHRLDGDGDWLACERLMGWW